MLDTTLWFTAAAQYPLGRQEDNLPFNANQEHKF